MKSYALKLGKDTYKLRLTAGAQRELQEEKGRAFMEIILECMTDPLAAIDILDKALNYKGNDNDITDGEELYDLMVDNGFEGAERFFAVVAATAQASGILTEDQKGKLEVAMAKITSGIYDKLTNLDDLLDNKKGDAGVDGDTPTDGSK